MKPTEPNQAHRTNAFDSSEATESSPDKTETSSPKRPKARPKAGLKIFLKRPSDKAPELTTASPQDAQEEAAPAEDQNRVEAEAAIEPPVAIPYDEMIDQPTIEIREDDPAQEVEVIPQEVEPAGQMQQQSLSQENHQEIYTDGPETPLSPLTADTQGERYVEREAIDVESEVITATDTSSMVIEDDQPAPELLQEIQAPVSVLEGDEETHLESAAAPSPESLFEPEQEMLPAPDEPVLINEDGEADFESGINSTDEVEEQVIVTEEYDDSESSSQTLSEIEEPVFADEEPRPGEYAGVESIEVEEQPYEAMGAESAAEEAIEVEVSSEGEPYTDRSEETDEVLPLDDPSVYEREYESREPTQEEKAPKENYSDISELVEKTEKVGAAVEDLSQEVKRVGQELLKINHTADLNNERFENALEGFRQLSDTVARRPDQHTEPSGGSVFEIKAPICREMLRVADTMEASLAAAGEVLAKLRESAEQSSHSVFPWSRPDEQLRLALKGAAEAMSKWHEGERLLYERLMTALSSGGVRPIESLGQTFNPDLHRAVSVQQNSELPQGTIVGEELRGYTLDGQILRYAEVIIVRNE